VISFFEKNLFCLRLYRRILFTRKEGKMRIRLVLSLMLVGMGVIFAGNNKSTKVEILIDGDSVPAYSHKGKTYIEAIKGKEYSIRISNPLEERIGVALSVDGLNTIDAKQTKPAKASKWVLEPYQTIVISGWQVSDQQARQFFFTNEDKSYAAKMGKAENLGLISASFFKERRPQIIQRIPVYPPFPPYIGGMMGGFGGGGMGGGMGAGMGGGGGMMGGGMGGMAGGAAATRPTAPGSQKPAISQPDSSQTSKPEYAATGMGNRVGHEVESVHMALEDKPFATVNLRYEFRDSLIKLKVPLDRPIEKEPLLRREKAKGYDDRRYSPEF
jgi:hypothetical protein